MTSRRARTRAGAPPPASDLDARIATAEAQAVVVWHGRPVAFAALPERVAAIANRSDRNLLLAGYIEAVEALNPLRVERLAARRATTTAEGDADLVASVARRNQFDPVALAVEMTRFLNASETVYYAALRRYLALIDIEQGDASVADLWHVLRGVGWNHWFESRRLEAALAATGARLGPDDVDSPDGTSGWAQAHARLTGTTDTTSGARVAGALRGWLLADIDWLESELTVPSSEAAALADFGAFTRLYRIRRDAALLAYELRLYRTEDPALQRAYFAGLQGLQTGVAVPDAFYLREVDDPFASAHRVRLEIAAGVVGEALRGRIGHRWWRAPEAVAEVGAVVAADTHEDVVARLGYDHLDWRPVLRQIRTQLIGEMSGYGGPNITTRAGTRKV
jgi:hypothetical protein